MRSFPPLAHPSKRDAIVFERDCYVTIFDQLVEIIGNPQVEIDNIHIDGSPGIGKSRFYLYCALRLALDAAVRAALPEFKLVLNCEDFYYVYDAEARVFNSVEQKARVRALRNDRRVVRLVEADSDQLSGWLGISILYSSPDHRRVNGFLKDHGYRYVMPAWSLPELRVYNSFPRPGQLDDETLVDLYNKRGGIPRSIFATSQEMFDQQLEDAVHGTHALKLRDLVASMGDIQGSTHCYCIAEMVPTHADCAIFVHCEFLSNHIVAIVANTLYLECQERLSALFVDQPLMTHAGTRAMIDSIYERLCHAKITTSHLQHEQQHQQQQQHHTQQRLAFRSLTGTTANPSAYEIEIPSDMPVVDFKTLAEIETHSDWNDVFQAQGQALWCSGRVHSREWRAANGLCPADDDQQSRGH